MYSSKKHMILKWQSLGPHSAEKKSTGRLKRKRGRKANENICLWWEWDSGPWPFPFLLNILVLYEQKHLQAEGTLAWMWMKDKVPPLLCSILKRYKVVRFKGAMGNIKKGLLIEMQNNLHNEDLT